MTTATQASLVGCHHCGQVSRARLLSAGLSAVCPRCGARLHPRKPNSISRTWALLIAAIILYIPANLFPVTVIQSLGRTEPDTILSGVKALIEADSWELAAILFFASITVPVLKILALSYLLISVQRKSHWRPEDRTRLYHVVEAVGRWSMIDVFVVSILIALVRFGNIVTFEPGIGVISFASVVILTMFAALTFDPRLIWDNMEEQQ